MGLKERGMGKIIELIIAVVTFATEILRGKNKRNGRKGNDDKGAAKKK